MIRAVWWVEPGLLFDALPSAGMVFSELLGVLSRTSREVAPGLSRLGAPPDDPARAKVQQSESGFYRTIMSGHSRIEWRE